MKNLKYILFTTLFLISYTMVHSAEDESFSINSLSLHIKITEMKDSETPFIYEDTIVFTYKPSKERVRHIGIAFENEDFSKIYNLYKNENGIYFFLYKYPKENVINYCFIEDGVWIKDRVNPLEKPSNNFLSLSSFVIPNKNVKEHITPIIDGNSATFNFKGAQDYPVYLTGDFNNWNPFLYQLKEDKPGLYSITIKLPPGKYGYYFIYNGKRTLDSENFTRGISKLGEEVSLFTIK